MSRNPVALSARPHTAAAGLAGVLAGLAATVAAQVLVEARTLMIVDIPFDNAGTG